MRAALVEAARLRGDVPAPRAARAGAPPHERVVLLDTSAVIDARFVELRRLGFLPGSLRVPRFVLAELQTLADSADDTRRARGRRGLDLLATLPAERRGAGLRDRLPRHPAGRREAHAAGRRAQGRRWSPWTTTSPRSLACRASRCSTSTRPPRRCGPTTCPGEVSGSGSSKQGKEADQGVGYLDDGTMVVVQGPRARRHRGRTSKSPRCCRPRPGG